VSRKPGVRRHRGAPTPPLLRPGSCVHPVSSGTVAAAARRRGVPRSSAQDEGVVTTEAAIAEHGLIGDLQTAALVSTDGSVDWFCCPRFDSPCSERCSTTSGAGTCACGRQTGRTSRSICTSRMRRCSSRGSQPMRERVKSSISCHHFMPPVERSATDNHRLVRMLRCVRGEMTFEIDVAPRFDYGRKAHRTELTHTGRCSAPMPSR